MSYEKPQTITIKPIGEDDWGRQLFRNVDNNRIYAMVDNVLHTTTQEGEPDCPFRQDLNIVIVDKIGFYNKLDGKRLAAISIEGTFEGELKATIELLAHENNIQESDIEVRYE